VGAIAAHLDTSILVALFIPEPFSERADAFVRDSSGGLMVGDLAVAEFSSAVARRVRMREFTLQQAAAVLSTHDEWPTRSARRVEIATADLALATAYIRRFDLSLRTPDALHLAIAHRLDAALFTFDRGLAAAARGLGMEVETR